MSEPHSKPPSTAAALPGSQQTGPAATPAGVRAKFLHQKRTVTILAIVLIVAGVVILFALKKPPLPLRIMAGLGDVFMGCVLLVLVRQQR